MSRKADPNTAETLQEAIETYPGQCPGFFARLLGWPREKVNRALVTLDDYGVLLSEDEYGGLWPCDEQG
ncbi:MAG: hypothetical protein HW418_2678 [Anaerolineales bacterium]|nr:hypothetical protein [Anaerolineales bacterium]